MTVLETVQGRFKDKRGQLGGFLARKHDGVPGVKTLWRRLPRLHDIASTWKLLYPSSHHS